MLSHTVCTLYRAQTPFACCIASFSSSQPILSRPNLTSTQLQVAARGGRGPGPGHAGAFSPSLLTLSFSACLTSCRCLASSAITCFRPCLTAATHKSLRLCKSHTDMVK